MFPTSVTSHRFQSVVVDQCVTASRWDLDHAESFQTSYHPFRGSPREFGNHRESLVVDGYGNAVAPEERWSLSVEGRVQGVGYRERVRRAGEALGLTGSVWNESDGSVSIEVQGVPETIGEFQRRISGARGASDANTVRRIARLASRDGDTRFEVRP
jgi:acylphosphatase